MPGSNVSANDARHSADKAVLIFDGECPLCSGAAAWVMRGARPGRIETLPCQSEERARRFPEVSESACLEAIQLVWTDGALHSGADALPRILSLMRGWRWLAWLLALPGLSLVARPAYRWIARNRHALSTILGGKHGRRC